MSNNLTYLDFAMDEALYLCEAHSKGLRYNAMVSQAQRICECYMKHIISKSLTYDLDIMRVHNLRSLYDYLEQMGLSVSDIRTDVMFLNNFYTHTRYPGRDAFMAQEQDINASVEAIQKIVKSLGRYV